MEMEKTKMLKLNFAPSGLRGTILAVPDEKLAAVDKSEAAQIKKKGLTEVLYYQGEHKPPDQSIITVCLLLCSGQVVARGVSLMNPTDQKYKLRGRVTARGRALRAYNRPTRLRVKEQREKTFAPLSFNREALKYRRAVCVDSETNEIKLAPDVFCFKSLENPVLTRYEELLVAKVIGARKRG